MGSSKLLSPPAPQQKSTVSSSQASAWNVRVGPKPWELLELAWVYNPCHKAKQFVYGQCMEGPSQTETAQVCNPGHKVEPLVRSMVHRTPSKSAARRAQGSYRPPVKGGGASAIDATVAAAAITRVP